MTHIMRIDEMTFQQQRTNADIGNKWRYAIKKFLDIRAMNPKSAKSFDIRNRHKNVQQNVNILVDTTGTIDKYVFEVFLDVVIDSCNRLGSYYELNVIPFGDVVDHKSTVTFNKDNHDMIVKSKETMQSLVEMLSDNNAGMQTSIKSCAKCIKQDNNNADVWIIYTDGFFDDKTEVKELDNIKNIKNILMCIVNRNVEYMFEHGKFDWVSDCKKVDKCLIEMDDIS